MAKIKNNFGFYAILTNPLKGYEYLANIITELEIPFLQLRIKDKKEFEILKIAEKIRLITENSSTLFIINDYPQIAIDCSADGVHLGQDDLNIEEAKKILPQNMIIGLSTHNPEQTRKSNDLLPDYIGIGPVYPTPTKKNPDPVIGITGMKEMLKIAKKPAVCIGGINLSNLKEVLEAGAKNICMVREVCQSHEPKKVLLKIKEIISQYSSENETN